MAIRILIADDQPLARAGLRMIIDAEPGMQVAGEASNGAEACDLWRALAPDVVLMDVRMPGMDGIAATREIAGGGGPGATKVVVLTTFDLDEYVYDALRAGASAFLLKDTEPRLILEAVRAVVDGEALLAPQVTRRLIERFVRLPGRAVEEPPAPDDRLRDLTDRQREVLRLVGRGMSNAEIARTMVIVEATVKTHVSNVFHRLGIRDRAQAVIVAYETGLVHPGEAPSPAPGS